VRAKEAEKRADGAGAPIAKYTDMPRFIFIVLPIAWTLGGCLPNPQSEWISSEGSSQRSTLEDPTILAQSTAPPAGGGFFDFDWGSAFSFSGSDDDHGAGPHARERARPTVEHRFGAMTGDHRVSIRSGGGSHSGGARRR
jgi:hypothetical protein